MSLYRPPVHTIKRQPTVVINEETFPTLSNTTNPINPTNPSNIYKDKLKFSMDENKKDEKKDELPKGWIVLDRNYNPKKNKDKNSNKDDFLLKEEQKEEKIRFDFSPLIHLWKKRREDYIELYGHDHYIKTFGYETYYHYHYPHLDEDTNPNLSHDEFLEEEDDMSSIE